MGYARKRTATFTGSSQQTAWCSLRAGGVVTLEGTWVGTVSLLRRGADMNSVAATNNSGDAITWSANGTYTLNPVLVQAEYALQCSAYTSGSIVAMIEGK